MLVGIYNINYNNNNWFFEFFWGGIILSIYLVRIMFQIYKEILIFLYKEIIIY